MVRGSFEEVVKVHLDDEVDLGYELFLGACGPVYRVERFVAVVRVYLQASAFLGPGGCSGVFVGNGAIVAPLASLVAAMSLLTSLISLLSSPGCGVVARTGDRPGGTAVVVAAVVVAAVVGAVVVGAVVLVSGSVSGLVPQAMVAAEMRSSSIAAVPVFVSISGAPFGLSSIRRPYRPV